MSLFNTFEIAGSGLTAQSLRLNATASNLANADSVATDPSKAYRSRQPVFAALMKEQDANGFASPLEEGASVGVQVLGVVESQAPIARRFEPGNPLADAEGYVYTSNVNTIEAMTDMISASRTFQSNVEVINTSRDLLLKTISMGR